MNLQEYYQLSQKDQEIAAMNGEFLADRPSVQGTVALYRVECFYVEVTYDPEMNAIVQISAFDGIKQLAPYIAEWMHKPLP